MFAYLDAGTFSYILQLIIGALLGCIFAIRIFRDKLKLFFKNLFSKTKKHND